MAVPDLHTGTLNLTQLRRNKRKRADKTSGRKQPRLRDVDVEPADDADADVAALLIDAVAGSSQSSESASHPSGECATQQVAESDQPTVIEAITIDTSICHACDLREPPARKCRRVTGMISWVGCESCPRCYHRVCLGIGPRAVISAYRCDPCC